MSEPVIRCNGVTKRYGDVLAVANASLEVAPGETLSILGPSGCGKTTLLRLIAGFDVPDSGEIGLQGRLVSGRWFNEPPDRRNVGMVFQEYALFPHMTVAQNVAFGLHKLSAGERRLRLAEVMDLVDLKGLEDRHPYELSGGQQQRVALARTLAPHPIAVLLDEPFSNLDAGMRRDMRQEVESILREYGIAAVFVTHDREEAFAMADRVGVMRAGRLDQVDKPEVIYHSPATPFVARMAGTCDFLSGEARGVMAITEIGTLSCTSSNGLLAEGTRVDLLVRPDDFRIEPDPEGAYTIRSREFRGDETILVVALPSGTTLRCRQRYYSTVAAGTRVTLAPENPRPFPAFKRSGTGS